MFTNISEVFTDAIIRAMSVLHITNNVQHVYRNAIDFVTNIVLLIEEVSTSETSINLYQATQRNIPEESLLHTQNLENLKYQCLKTL